MAFHTCKNCNNQFEIRNEDIQFYQKIDVPHPTNCPDCRQQQRIRHINQIKLFKRPCDATGVSIITNHPPYVPYPVYSQAHWYSDKVDNTTFGTEIDFSKPFFDQFFELSCKVPRPCVFTDYSRDENSEYTNYAGINKNCYLIFDSDCNWDCMYSYSLNSCKNTNDCYRGDLLELCFECIDCKECYASTYLQDCQTCSNSSYLKNCIGVKTSLFCANLHQKEYFLFNKQSTKEEIAAIKKSLNDKTLLAKYLKEYSDLLLALPERAIKGVQNEESIGNYLTNCKRAHYCFDSRDIWDGAYLYQVFMSIKDSVDCHEVGNGELLYECSNIGYNAFNCYFCKNCLEQISNLTYCDYCFLGSHDLFGCIGLKRKSYCILNKEYSEKSYKELRGKLVNHMKDTGEWGRFYPERLSHFAYNHSHANVFYPLTEDEAGFLKKWWIKEEGRVNQKTSGDISCCEDCKAPFKLVQEEREFYLKQNITPPTRCFTCRHQARLNKRASRLLVDTRCDQCGIQMQAPFNKTKQKLYCEECFREARI